MEEGCEIWRSSSPLRSQAQKVHEQGFTPHLESSEAQASSTSLREGPWGTALWEALSGIWVLGLSALLQLNSLWPREHFWIFLCLSCLTGKMDPVGKGSTNPIKRQGECGVGTWQSPSVSFGFQSELSEVKMSEIQISQEEPDYMHPCENGSDFK